MGCSTSNPISVVTVPDKMKQEIQSGSSSSFIQTNSKSESSSEANLVTLSDFSIEKELGRGGFGIVHAVRKINGPDSGKWYAMKTMSKRAVLDRRQADVVMNERNLLAHLHYFHLTNLAYAIDNDSNLYLFTDLCLGGDMLYQLRRCATIVDASIGSVVNRMPEDRVVFYASNIVLFLRHLHNKKIIHRDIKPENLVLDSSGYLKVTDLGTATQTNGITGAAGTKPYMAPESFFPAPCLSFMSDFYSLGVTLFQLLTGTRPYKPTKSNIQMLVRMSLFIPPAHYTDISLIRRILSSAQERKLAMIQKTEFLYSHRLAHVSPDCRDFVISCLICNPRFRLGKDGVREVMNHPWFSKVNWSKLKKRNIPPPYLPSVQQVTNSDKKMNITNKVLIDQHLVEQHQSEPQLRDQSVVQQRSQPDLDNPQVVQEVPLTAEEQRVFSGFYFRRGVTPVPQLQPITQGSAPTKDRAYLEVLNYIPPTKLDSENRLAVAAINFAIETRTLTRSLMYHHGVKEGSEYDSDPAIAGPDAVESFLPEVVDDDVGSRAGVSPGPIPDKESRGGGVDASPQQPLTPSPILAIKECI